MKNKHTFIFFVLCLVSFFLRLKSYVAHPFWVDEFSTAYEAKLLIQYGLSLFTNTHIYFESQNIIPHILVAIFFQTFGVNEFTARLPFILIGALVPSFMYLTAKKIFDERTAFVSTILGTFSYFFITWSQQARGYVLQQIFVLCILFFYLQVIEKKSNQKVSLLFLILSSIGGILTHPLVMFAIFAIAFHYVLFYHKQSWRMVKKPLFLVVIALLTVIMILTGLLNREVQALIATFSHHFTNNFWYYHSFLWREYMLVTFLAIVGWGIAAFTKTKSAVLVLLYMLFHLFFISFILGPYVSRYTLPFFPFLFIGMAYSIVYLSDLFFASQKKSKIISFFSSCFPFLVVLFIVISGEKFTVLPKKFYSVDHDFREIALIDYDQVYAIIRAKGDLAKGQTAVIDTWGDRLAWYVGKDYPGAYFFRWVYDPVMNASTHFTYNQENEKVLPDRNNMKYISDVSDLQKAMKKYSKGFIWIDDATLPADVITFAQQHLHKELYLDHYALDDNPYSLWPGTLYSWGVSP